MWPIWLIMLAAAVGVATYLYRFLRRIFQTFGADTKRVGVRIVLSVLAIGLGAACINVTGFGAIIVLHVLLMAMLVQLANFILKKLAGETYNKKFSAWKKLYGSGAIPILVSAALLTFGYFNLHNIVETDYTVYTHKNIRPEGYRVALIADIHFGVSIQYDELLQKCGEISEKDADLVVLCGDIVDDATSREEMEAVFKALGTIESRYGIYYVYGNHDRPMDLLESDYTKEELIRAIEGNGIRILQDELLEITDDLVLAAREDWSRKRFAGTDRVPIDALLQDADPDAFILTLDHQPREYEENGEAGTDLLLSGHTHGGQLWPLDLIQRIFPFNDAVYGHTWIDSDTQAIVTSGLAGWRYPVKTAAPAEYVVIDIQHS